MADFEGKLQDLAKNKKVLIVAAVVGAGIGLYYLSQNGGFGGGMPGGYGNGGTIPPTDANPDSSGGDSSGDVAGIAAQVAELASGQVGLQQAIAGLSDWVNRAISGVQSDNQSALQGVIDQVNGAIGNQQTAATVPDFAGFASQLFSQLPAYTEAARTNATGLVQLNMIPSKVSQPGKTILQRASEIRPPNTYRPPNNITTQLGAAILNLQSSIRKSVSTPKTTINRGVPMNIGSSYIPYLTGAVRRLPTIKPPTKAVVKIKRGGGGGGLLRG